MKPGDSHYKAYIGRPELWEHMGRSQFDLLLSLGLKPEHYLLDFGCGSLRAGRFLIPYLDDNHYFGIEPNFWLVNEGIENELGRDTFNEKWPIFSHNDDFNANVFGRAFDFILAQSIFSHASRSMILKALKSFHGDTIVATFCPSDRDYDGDKWVYPNTVPYRQETINRMAEEANLSIEPLDWPHPSQRWYKLKGM